jgi:hypothetical protein
MKRQSFAPRGQAGLKLSTNTSGRISSSGTTASPKAAAQAVNNDSSSRQQPVSPAELGLSASQLHPRTCSDGAGQYQQHNDDDDASILAGDQSNLNNSSSGSIQGQLQVLRAHHAGLMRLGLLMALTM